MIRIYDSGYRGDCRQEWAEQIDAMGWVEFNHPERWPLVFHVANEIKASPQYMQKRQKMGVKPGVSDIVDLGSVRGVFELKRADKLKSKVSAEQKSFLTAVDQSGGFAAICYGFQEFKRAYADYLAFVAENS